MNYGLPYKGSKSKLAARILECIPSASVFVDLFCGGCAVAHAALLSGRFGKVVINDIEGDVSRLFADAVNGRFRNETRWISREDFFRLKDTEPYVRYCWSFGNNGRDYLYSKAVEPYKRAVHYAVVFGDFAELRRLCPLVADDAEKALEGLTTKKTRRVEIGRAIVRRLRGCKPEDLKSNPLYGQIRLKSGGTVRSQRLESLQSLERYSTDYRDVPIEDGGVVYCDPPYKGAGGYVTGAFDHDAFYDWVRNAEFPVYVSEYSMPEDFIPVWEKPVAVLANQKGADGKVTERLYLHEKWANEVWKPTLF